MNGVDLKKREKLLNQKSFLIWFTGMSGSGKTTIGNLLEKELHERGYLTFILDGDNVRKDLNSDLDFSEKGREENIRRIGYVAKLMIDAGVITIATFISPFDKDRKRVKNLFEKDRFIEVFVDCPLNVCIERDPKGLYKKALNNEIPEFTGISSPYEKPLKPDIKIDTSKKSISEEIDYILIFLKEKGFIR